MVKTYGFLFFYLGFSFYLRLLACRMYIRLSFANEDFCSKLSEPQRRFALRIQHFSENFYSIPKFAEFLMTQPHFLFFLDKKKNKVYNENERKYK